MNWPKQLMHQLMPMWHMRRPQMAEHLSYGETDFNRQPYTDDSRAFSEQLYDVRAAEDVQGTSDELSSVEPRQPRAWNNSMFPGMPPSQEALSEPQDSTSLRATDTAEITEAVKNVKEIDGPSQAEHVGRVAEVSVGQEFQAMNGMPTDQQLEPAQENMDSARDPRAALPQSGMEMGLPDPFQQPLANGTPMDLEQTILNDPLQDPLLNPLLQHPFLGPMLPPLFGPLR